MSSNVEILLKAVDNASKALNDIEKEIKDIDGAGEKTKKSTEKFGDQLAGIRVEALALTAAIAGVGAAAVKIYELGKAGAEIEFTEIKFERLAETIGTTAEALESDLGRATQGLMSNSQMIQSATDVISLGLVKNQEDAVRLVTVMSNLGMDMNQVVLTLSNQTTMRFDQLGVAVDGFDEKLQGLKDSGMDVNEAFTEAFLQQAEAQLEKVGSVADTNAGKIMQLESAWKNLGDAIKVALAGPVAKVASSLANDINLMQKLREAVEKNIVTQAEARKMGHDIEVGALSEADALAYLAALTEAYTERVEFLQGAMGPLAPMFEAAGQAAEDAGDQFKASAAQIAAAEMDAGDLEKVTKDVRDRANEAALAYNNLATEVKNITSKDFAKLKIEGLENLMAVETDPAQIQAYADEIKEINLRYGFATESGYALAGAITYIDQMTADGVLSAGSYSEALDVAKKAAADGTLTYGELTEALETAGLTVQTTAAIMNEQDLDPIIEDTGRLAGNLAGIAGADTSKTFSYTINVKTTGPIGLLGQGGFGRSDTITFTEGGEPTYQHATGGSWIIPSGYEHDNFPLGGGHYGKSGETVTVTPVGQSAPDNGNTELLAALLAEFRNQPKAIGLAVEQALQRLGN